MNKQNKLTKYTPRVSKRTLLIEAACVWLIAGSILLYRGYASLVAITTINWWIVFACILGGVGFYRLLFLKISNKYIARIKEHRSERPCAFSFFSIKGYLMMAFMITFGITLKKTGIIPPVPMGYFFFLMATPLLLSAFKFLYAGLFYNNDNRTNDTDMDSKGKHLD